MTCRKCGSQDVSVQLVQTGANTTSKGKAKGRGCLARLFWLMMVCCTCGFALLFYRKKYKTKGTSKTEYIHEKMAVCNNCGHTWILKKKS